MTEKYPNSRYPDHPPGEDVGKYFDMLGGAYGQTTPSEPSPDYSSDNRDTTFNPAATAWLFAFILGGIAWANDGSVIVAGIIGLVIGYFIRQIIAFALIIFIIFALFQMFG